jgi:Effector Associated Constant Component 1
MQLLIRIETDSGADDQERVELTRKLRKQLLSLDEVEGAEPATAPAGPGTKSAGVDWQALMVTLASSGGILTTLTGTIQSWLTRQDRSTVTLEIGGDKLTVTGASSDTQKRLVNDWIKRHKG